MNTWVGIIVLLGIIFIGMYGGTMNQPGGPFQGRVTWLYSMNPTVVILVFSGQLICFYESHCQNFYDTHV
jgi:hypothetical protein